MHSEHQEWAEMQKRRLGRSDIELPPIMFGGNVFGWTADEATSFKLLDTCVAAGINAIDTADVYSVWARGHQGGESEVVIGNWLKRRGKRDDVIIATKVGTRWAQATRVCRAAGSSRHVKRRCNGCRPT